MRELQRKQKLKKILYSLPMLALLAAFTAFLAKGAFGIMKIERRSAERVGSLEAEALVLDNRRRELNGEIERLKTDEGIMEEIREKFSVARDGEHVAIIVEEKTRGGEKAAEDSWYKRFWNAIISIYE
jgi:cell division protein FtsB